MQSRSIRQNKLELKDIQVPELRELHTRSDILDAEIERFEKEGYSWGAAIELFQGQRYADQTLPVLGIGPRRTYKLPDGKGGEREKALGLGQEIFRLTKEAMSHAFRLPPENIVAMLASGSGVAEPLTYNNALYHTQARQGTAHVLHFGPFGARIAEQFRRASTKKNLKVHDYEYGTAPAVGDETWEVIKRHIQEKVKNKDTSSDTIAFVHLETGTAAEVKKIEDYVKSLADLYKEEGRSIDIKPPLIVLDTTSSKGVNYDTLKGYAVMAYQGSAKPVTAEMQMGFVMGTDEGWKLYEKRMKWIKLARKYSDGRGRSTGAINKLMGLNGKERPEYIIEPGLYTDAIAERIQQNEDTRGSFTQSMHTIRDIGRNLLDYLKSGYAWNRKAEDMNQVATSAYKYMDAKRRITQEHIKNSLGALGIGEEKIFPKSTSTMLGAYMTSLKDKDTGKEVNIAKELRTELNKYYYDMHVGYAGLKPEFWKKSRAGSPEKINRISTYWVVDPVKSAEHFEKVVDSIKTLARRKNLELPADFDEKLKQAKIRTERQTNILEKGIRGWNLYQKIGAKKQEMTARNSAKS